MFPESGWDFAILADEITAYLGSEFCTAVMLFTLGLGLAGVLMRFWSRVERVLS